MDSLDVGVGDVELEEPDVLEVLLVGEPAVGQQPSWEGLRLGGSHSHPGRLLPLLLLLRHSHAIQEVKSVRRGKPVGKREEEDLGFYNDVLLYVLQSTGAQ